MEGLSKGSMKCYLWAIHDSNSMVTEQNMVRCNISEIHGNNGLNLT